MSRRQEYQPGGTGDLRKAARAFKTSKRKLATAMLEAHDAGTSLRVISADTGYSHENVRAIIARERRRIIAVEEEIGRRHNGPGLTINGMDRNEARIRALTRTLPVKRADE